MRILPESADYLKAANDADSSKSDFGNGGLFLKRRISSGLSGKRTNKITLELGFVSESGPEWKVSSQSPSSGCRAGVSPKCCNPIFRIKWLLAGVSLEV